MQEHAPIYTVYWSGRKYLAHMTRVRVRVRVWVARARAHDKVNCWGFSAC